MPPSTLLCVPAVGTQEVPAPARKHMARFKFLSQSYFWAPAIPPTLFESPGPSLPCHWLRPPGPWGDPAGCSGWLEAGRVRGRGRAAPRLSLFVLKAGGGGIAIKHWVCCCRVQGSIPSTPCARAALKKASQCITRDQKEISPGWPGRWRSG